MIRKYFDKYTRWNSNKWVWQPYIYAHNCSLEEQREWNDLYLKYRARKSDPKYPWGNNDKVIPDFYSIERDAEQFDLHEVTFTDIFGMKWTGKKGCEEIIDSPDYEGHLYYYNEEWDDFDINYEYDDNKNQPDVSIYERFDLGYPRFRTEWIDIVNIKDIEYHYVVENHLFKDSRIEYTYDNGDKDVIFDNGLSTFVHALKKFGKIDLYEKLMKQINKHFEALKTSDREEERNFYPNCTAEEYFEKY